MIIRWVYTIWISLENAEKLGDYVVNVVEAGSNEEKKS